MIKEMTTGITPVLIIFLMFFLAGCGGGSEDDNRGPTVDVTGFWEGEWESADNFGIFNFLMTQNGADVEGMNTRLGQFTGGVRASILYIDGTDLYGVVNGDLMSGVYTGNNGEVVTFECQRKGTTDFVHLE